MRFISRIPILVWVGLVTFVIIGGGVWFVSSGSLEKDQTEDNRPQAVSSPVEGTQDFDVASRTHIAQGTNSQDFNTNPPSSGQHWASPAEVGYYDSPLVDEQVVHNLEHGHVWLTFKPDVAQEIKDKIKAIVEADSWKVVAASREANDSKFAYVAWGRVLKMEEFDENKVKDFIKTYRNRGPEKTPD